MFKKKTLSPCEEELDLDGKSIKENRHKVGEQIKAKRARKKKDVN
jgi:hypothetical protein